MAEKNGSILTWLTYADKDYLSARSLLINKFLIQGCCLANTAVEKYLKTILLIDGVDFERNHNIPSLLRKTILKDINEDFLKFLYKSYKLRYPEDLSIDFNISINQLKTLLELDRTVLTLRKGFIIKKKDGTIIKTYFDHLLETEDEVLFLKNCFFGRADKEGLLKEESYCYEMRVLRNGILEADYITADKIPDDGKFDQEGLKPKTH